MLTSVPAHRILRGNHPLLHTYIHIHTHTYTYTYTYKYIHTYIYIYICSRAYRRIVSSAVITLSSASISVSAVRGLVVTAAAALRNRR